RRRAGRRRPGHRLDRPAVRRARPVARGARALRRVPARARQAPRLHAQRGPARPRGARAARRCRGRHGPRGRGRPRGGREGEPRRVARAAGRGGARVGGVRGAQPGARGAPRERGARALAARRGAARRHRDRGDRPRRAHEPARRAARGLGAARPHGGRRPGRGGRGGRRRGARPVGPRVRRGDDARRGAAAVGAGGAAPARVRSRRLLSVRRHNLDASRRKPGRDRSLLGEPDDEVGSDEGDAMPAPPVRRPLALAVTGALLLAGATTVAPAHAAVPDPTVTGPVPVTSPLGDPAHGYPFLATDYDLTSRGYVEEEFFVEGQATRYQADGVTDATVLSTGHDYRTRIVVRRPVDPAAFNGTVIAEWYNVSNQWDQEVDWFQTHEHLVRGGYAWVGVSAQVAGVHSATGLRAWSPDRYGTLDLTDGGAVTDDTLSWDVFSQAVAAVRDPAGVAPLGPLDAERVVATGHSQSAGRLWSYVNSVDPLAGVVDAVVLHGGGGLVRDDIDTPVFKINSETDVAIDLLGAAQRQPDSELLPTWEVAGASHGDWKLITDYGRLRLRDVGSAPGGYPGTPQTCEQPSGSRVPQHMVQGAVYDHVAAWVADGTAPPSAAPIELTDTPRTVVRDERGLGQGGIRLAQQDVPTRINSGANAGPGFCFLDGGSTPVDDATLAAW